MGRMMPRSTFIGGVTLVETRQHRDARGSLARWFCDADLAAVTGGRRIMQINHSRTTATGVVRGMHYQVIPHQEMKLVRCIRGRAFDVALDLRKGSPTFLRWHGVELSADNGLMLVIPEGCAHGFQTLVTDCELLYLHTVAYAPASEGGVQPTDPMVAIDWPLPVTELSDRDRNHPLLTPGFSGLDA